jgi:hypothetical protein
MVEIAMAPIPESPDRATNAATPSASQTIPLFFHERRTAGVHMLSDAPLGVCFELQFTNPF